MARYFLILEQDAVIAQDLTEMLRDYDPRREIVAVTDLDRARRMISVRDSPLDAILNWPYSDLLASDLDELVASRDGRIFVTRGAGRNDGDLPHHWIAVQSPFTTDILISALK